MRRLKLLGVVLLTIVLAGCSEPAPPLVLDEPPGLVVTIGDTRVEAVAENYRWNARSGQLRMESLPPESFARNFLKPVTVPAGSVANLSLVLPPEEGTLVAQQWRPDFSRKPAEPIKDGEILLPDDPGIYTYSVSARWKQGEVSYAFQVEIR